MIKVVFDAFVNTDITFRGYQHRSALYTVAYDLPRPLKHAARQICVPTSGAAARPFKPC